MIVRKFAQFQAKASKAAGSPISTTIYVASSAAGRTCFPSANRTVEHQALLSRRTSMLRATGIGIVSAIALGVGLASPAAAMGGHVGGHGSMGGSMGGSAMRGGAV